MRSRLAIALALCALVPLIPALIQFVEVARSTYRSDGLAISNDAFFTLAQGVVAPFGFLAAAAIVEMLYRISVALERGEPVTSRPQAAWPFRNPIAVIFVIGAALTLVVGLVGFGRSLFEDYSEIPGGAWRLPIGSLTFALGAAFDVFAIAAVVEYLSRIAAAYRADD